MIVVATRLESGGRGEDRLAVEPDGTGGLLVVVADGAGGTGAGGQAADAVCAGALEAFRRGVVNDRWDDPLRRIDGIVAGIGHGGLTTAVVARIEAGRVSGASVGDSSAWMIAEDGIVDLTERQARKPLIGSGRATPMAFGPIGLRGRVVVGSDGLFKYASRAHLAAAALRGDVEGAATALVDAVRLRNGGLQDDVAVVVAARAGALDG